MEATSSADSTPSIEELQRSDRPFVLVDHGGLVLAINQAFQEAYGWEEKDLLDQPLSMILPEAFQMSHHLGFSRFQATELSTILAHPLRLKTACRDGSVCVSEHYIVAEKHGDNWLFGATLTPLPEGTQPDA